MRFLKWMKQSHIIADVDVLRCVQEDGSSQDIVKILRNLKSYESECLFKFCITFLLESIACIIFSPIELPTIKVFSSRHKLNPIDSRNGQKNLFYRMKQRNFFMKC
jgi:hypothetical protein